MNLAKVLDTKLLDNKGQKSGRSAILPDSEINIDKLNHACNSRIAVLFDSVAEQYKSVIEALIAEKRKKLIKTRKELTKIQKDNRSFKESVYGMISNMREKDIDSSGDHFVQVLDLLNETVQHLDYIAYHAYNHVDNGHEPFRVEEADSLMAYANRYREFLEQSYARFSKESLHHFESMNDSVQALLSILIKMRKNHLERIRTASLSPGASILYLDILNSSKNLVLVVYKLFSASHQFSTAPEHRIDA